MTEKIYHFYNDYHYGDNLLNLKFLKNILHYLKDANIKIIYYYNKRYIKNVYELERYIDNDIITLRTTNYRPRDAICLWMGCINFDKVNYSNFDIYFNLFYKNITTILNLDNKQINTSLYQDEEYLLDIYNSLDSKYKDIDILIINSVPYSGQIQYNKEEWDKMCIDLSKKYNIVTTTFVNNDIKCTFTDGLRLQDIGAISTHVKYIIAVHSGPIVPCYNSLTKKNVKKWFIFQDSGYHSEIIVENFCTQYLVYEYFKLE